jgi:RNA polymerase sigma-70 factor (ECF subfamily)
VAEQVTQLLLAWGAGDESALERLMPLVHNELHRLARRYMRSERADHSFQPTALVNETYLRLVDASRVRWQDRAHFLALCGRLMRRILVDHARSRGYLKRGGGTIRVALSDGNIVSERATDVVALDDALASLATIDPRKCQVVEMRFFAGLSVTETAQALAVSPDTVMRDWKMAKVWLLREIQKT